MGRDARRTPSNFVIAERESCARLFASFTMYRIFWNYFFGGSVGPKRTQ
jgi:hypothetical protein